MQRGAWIAIHNGTLNHPLNYPFDTVNQSGTPVTQAEFDSHSYGAWAGDLAWVNSERVRGKNPGQALTSVDANGKDKGGSNCWLKFDAYENIFEGTFGFQLPILGTEGGVWVGTKVGEEPYNSSRIYDPRYPAVSVEMQKNWTAEICRAMMDGEYPNYYFCTGFWLMANKGMGNSHMPFERDAWYSYYWGGQLPVVQALKDLPKQIRPATVPVILPGILSDMQIAELCRSKGFTGEALTTMVAIILAESGGDPLAFNDQGNTPPGSLDVGLVMINLFWHPEVTRAQAENPDYSVSYAWELSQRGTYWGHWAAYNAGTYKTEGRWERALDVTCEEPDAEELKNAAWNSMGVAYNEYFAFPKYAVAHNLGVPIKEAFDFTINCVFYRGQIFIGSGVTFVYCKIGDWENVKSMGL
jgi:hypothetical protein